VGFGLGAGQEEDLYKSVGHCFNLKNFQQNKLIMKRNEYMANRLNELFISGRWIANTNIRELLSGIDWKRATKKIEELNTIAALTYHINYYLAGVLSVLNGGCLETKDKYSFDVSPIQSNTGWVNLVSELIKNAEQFAESVRQLPDEKFDEVFVDEKYGNYLRNIEAIIEHSYYHFGQISILKKLTRKE